jgi:hypothetical protein
MYARIAMNTGYLKQSDYEEINAIQAPPDEQNEERRGEKRGTYLSLSDELVERLLRQPDTLRGYRDALIIALLLKCGLWPREIAALNRHSIDIQGGTLTFYNYHEEEEQVLKLDEWTLRTATRYLQDKSPYEALFVGNQKESTHTLRLTDRAINDRVRTLGEKIGIKTLAPQDCHVYWEQSQHYQQHLQQQQKQSSTLLVTVEQKEVTMTSRPPQRKRRPDILNRKSFEDAMKFHGVDESLISPAVSEYRLLIPLMIEYLDKLELQQDFLLYVEQQLAALNLGKARSSYESTLEQIKLWMKEEMERYKATREDA